MKEKMEIKVDRFLKQKGFAFEAKKILIGVSGGADSLALLNYLLNKQQEQNFSLVAAMLIICLEGMSLLRMLNL